MTRHTLALAALVAACGAARTGTTTPRARGDITAAELVSLGATDAYDAVAKLRPLWLRSRGVTSWTDPSAGQVLAYLDGVRLGGVEELRRMRTENARAIRFHDATAALARWGRGHEGGVIEVLTR